MKEIDIERFKEICKPVVEYIKDNYHPHCKVIITDSNAVLVEDEIGVSFVKDRLEGINHRIIREDN